MGGRLTAFARRFCLGVLGLAALFAQAAHATNIVVSNNNDVVNGNISSPAALIASNGGDGISLREALLAANNAVGPHTISFNGALAGQTITLTNRFTPITQDGITITGLTSGGQPNITIDGANLNDPSVGSILFIAASSFSMTGMRLTNIQPNYGGIQIGGTSYGLQGQTVTSPQQISNFTISGNSFSNGISDGVFAIFLCHSVNITSNATISNAVFANNSFSHLYEGINIQGGGTGNVIQDVVIYGNSFSQHTAVGTSAVELGNTAGASNVIQRVQVIQNTFTDDFQGVALDINSTATGTSIQDTLIARNVFTGNLGAMVVVAGVDSTSSNNTIANTQFVNNVFVLTGYQSQGSGVGQVIDNQNGGSNNTVNGVSFVNNTIYSNGQSGGPGAGLWVTSSGGVSNVSVLNSIFWGIAGDTFSGLAPSQVSYSIVNQSGFTGTNHNFNSDPLFVNTATNNFHLQAGSPAIGAGLSTGAPPTDSDCQARGNPPSIGAYEFNRPNVCAAVSQTLQLSPSGNMAASGNQGGPFSPASFGYDLSASGGSVNYSISGLPSWLDVSSSSGTATASAVAITFTVNASANSLAVGAYGPTTITFTNTTNGQGTQTRTATLTVNALSSPTVSWGGNVTFNEGASSTPVVLSTAFTITPGTTTLATRATIRIVSGFQPGDVLSTDPTGTAITASYKAAAGVLTLTGTDTEIDYQALVKFGLTTFNAGCAASKNGTDLSRTISYQITDANGLASNVATSTVTIVPSGINCPSPPGPTTVYVSAQNGSDTGLCPISAPCATLNYALSVSYYGGQISILDGGIFGPAILNGPIAILGNSPKVDVQIAADPTAQVGCIGALPSDCGLSNNGYAIEIAAGVGDTVTLTNLQIGAGGNGAGALKLSSGGKIQLGNNIFRGNGTQTGPIVALYPNNPGTTQAQVYFSNSDVGFNNSGANAGAIEVMPAGNTSLKLHFNHVEVHNASYGIRTDLSLLSGPSINVATAISESEFFSFANAAVNAFSTAGTGTTNAAFDAVRVLNANVAIKANGPQSTVILTNSTISGNGTGVQVLNGGHVYTPQNNTITGNGADLSGSLSSSPPR